MFNRDEAKGSADQAAGRVKQAAGDFSDNPDLRAEGEAQELGGKVQQGFGTARRKALAKLHRRAVLTDF